MIKKPCDIHKYAAHENPTFLTDSFYTYFMLRNTIESLAFAHKIYSSSFSETCKGKWAS